MKFTEVVDICHVRGAIYRTGDPTEIFTEECLMQLPPALQEISRGMVGRVVPKVYWKNHYRPFTERIPIKDMLCDDWEEYDPRDQPECSAFNEAPA